MTRSGHRRANFLMREKKNSKKRGSEFFFSQNLNVSEAKIMFTSNFSPRRVLAQRPKPEEAPYESLRDCTYTKIKNIC